MCDSNNNENTETQRQREQFIENQFFDDFETQFTKSQQNFGRVEGNINRELEELNRQRNMCTNILSRLRDPDNRFKIETLLDQVERKIKNRNEMLQ